MHNYIFKSTRLGFRNWHLNDLDTLAKINDDDDVMEFFPFKPTKSDTEDFIFRMQNMQQEKGFSYFAVDLLENNECIGFIGLCEQNYLVDPKPFVDIGWRLKKSTWGKGYATEGAFACLDFGFNKLGLQTIYSVAPEINTKSESVMKKIGMVQVEVFDHPKLLNYNRLRRCVLYKKEKNS